MQKITISPNKQIYLVCVAIFLQFFSHTHFFFIERYVSLREGIDHSFHLSKFNAYISSFVLVAVIGKICGAYLIGKYSNKVETLAQNLTLVAKLFFLKSLLFALLCITKPDDDQLLDGLYLVRFMYESMSFVALILPSIYLFKKTDKSKWLLISGSIMLSFIVGRSLGACLQFAPDNFIKIYPYISLVTISIPYFIYDHIQKNLDPIKPEENAIKPNLEKKIWGMVLGALTGMVFFYHSFFLNTYVMNVTIINDYDFKIGDIFYLVSLGIFIIPGIFLCKKFGIYKVAIFSLLSLTLLSFDSFFPINNTVFYFAHQLVYSFFSALLITSLLFTLHIIFKDTPQIFDQVFWFSFGWSVWVILAYYGSKFGFENNMPSTGRLIFITSIILSLFLMHKLRFSGKKTEKAITVMDKFC